MWVGQPARKIVDAAKNTSYEWRSGNNLPQPTIMKAKQLPLSDFCIYTILHSDKLKLIFRNGGTDKFTENKKWATALALWERAEKANEQLPLIFAAAQSVSRLIYWGVITNLRPGPSTKAESTTINFTGLKPIRGKPRFHNSLRLRSTRKALSDKFIKPYAICYTPNSLREKQKGR